MIFLMVSSRAVPSRSSVVGLQKVRIKRRLEDAQNGGDVSTVRLDAGNSLRIKRYG
jgi:hypothetical protein